MTMKLIDIGANLTDKVFNGIYRSVQLHINDFHTVLSRAKNNGVSKIIVTSGSLADSKEALSICQLDTSLYCTAGCHPTRCQETNQDGYFDNLKALILSESKKIVAVGECGLDYDRTNFCSIEIQKIGFMYQLELASVVNLPLFLHCRGAHSDFLSMIKDAKSQYFKDKPIRGVVHSFDGTLTDVEEIIHLGLYIGINGCSLKNEQNLQVVKSIPLDSLLLETDAPWCEIRPTHASYKYVKTHPIYRKPKQWEPTAMIKGRNEPANLVQVLEVVAALKNIKADELATITYNNTLKLFSLEFYTTNNS